jgi:hypothetical protein
MRTFASVVVVAVICLSSLSGCVRRVMRPPVGPQEQATEEPPAGMVEVSMVSEFEDQVWDVFARGTKICTTPCTQWVRAHENLVFKARNGDLLFVEGLGEDAMKARRALLVAEGGCDGKEINGIVWTSFGGMGVVTGITFTAVGCSDPERRGMCNAGLITGGASLALTGFGLWLLLDSGPKAHIMPVFKAHAFNGHPPVKFALAPNGIVGTF